MNPRPLLIAITIGSALLGTTLAMRLYPRSAAVPIESEQPLQTGSLSAPNPTPLAGLAGEGTPDEFDQIRIQLRRAIRDRNLVLLRSLLQAGSVREALRSVGAAETMSFEHFDQSTWTVLEKALNYHCRQSVEGLNSASCFERQSPQPLP